MTDEESEASITITYDGDPIELQGRHAATLLLADSVEREITSTEARDAAPVKLPHSEQGRRIFRDLAEYELLESWQPDERVDGRAIPAAYRAHLTRRGREFVEAHRLKLETMEPLNRETEVMRQMLSEHREEIRSELDDVSERIARVEEQADEAQEMSDEVFSELEDRVEMLEKRVDAAGKARNKLSERVSSLETEVSRHSDFIKEQGRGLKKLRRTVKSRL